MEEAQATQGIGMDYDYRATAAQAVVDRERYIRRFLKNNLSEVKSKKEVKKRKNGNNRKFK